MSAIEKALVDWAAESTALEVEDRLRAGLAVLWRAYICAQDTGANVWDLSLPTSRLSETGMTSSDLHWMVVKGFAEHGEETTGYGDAHRSFRRGNGYFLSARSRLVLTPSGAALAEDVFGETGRSPRITISALAAVADKTFTLASARRAAYERDTPALKPRWDAIRRELSFAGLIVKRFRVPARNQETILGVFQEEGWAPHIHDPLPVTHDIDAPTRLHDAINRLNRRQINPLVRFHGDGKGTGVFWELNQADLLS
jgi:hypothetical protein